MNTTSTLVGYVRKSTNGGALRMSISTEAFRNAKTYDSKDGSTYVNLIVNLAKVQEVINGDRAVTSVCQLHDGEAPVTTPPAAAAPAPVETPKPKKAKK